MAAGFADRFEELSSRQREFSAELDPAAESNFLDFYVRLIPRVLNAERCSVFIHDPAANKVWLKAGTGLKERGIEVSARDSIVGQVISTGKFAIATDLESREGTHKSTDTTTGFTTRQVICVPIRSRDGKQVTGAIQVLNRKGGGQFTQEDRQFLEEVGTHFQRIVESIFLGQEALRISGEAVAAAGRATKLNYLWASGSFVFLALFGLALAMKIVRIGQSVF